MIATLVACLLVASASRSAAQTVLQRSSSLTCDELFGGKAATVLLSAVPGTDGEGQYYYQNLQDPFVVDASTILQQNVVVAGTGIAVVNAALCTMELLACSDYVKEMIWSGTSGFSAQVGGAFTPSGEVGSAYDYELEGSCAPNTNPITRIGDLCIATTAVQFDCKEANWQQQCEGYPNLCTYPSAVLGPNEELATGPCVFSRYFSADVELADELMAAFVRPSAISVPERSDTIASYEANYWGNMTAGTGVEYEYDPLKVPTLWNYTTCAEASSQFFWTGPTYDIVQREYVAMTIADSFGMNVTAQDVIGASAEETTGFVNAIYHYLDSGGEAFPWIIVRGSSDYTYGPLVGEGNGVYSALSTFNTGEFYEEQVGARLLNPSCTCVHASPDFTFSFVQSVFSSAVLNLLLARCEGANGVGSPQCQLLVPLSDSGIATVGNDGVLPLTPCWPMQVPLSDSGIATVGNNPDAA